MSLPIEAIEKQIFNMAYKHFVKKMDKVAKQSQSDVPVDTGALKRSMEFKSDISEKEISISYGNGNVDYAIIVHEDLSTYPKSGKRKFLEDPFNELVSTIR